MNWLKRRIARWLINEIHAELKTRPAAGIIRYTSVQLSKETYGKPNAAPKPPPSDYDSGSGR